MKGILLFFFVSLLLFPGVVLADCSIGATPLEMNLEASPGETVTAYWSLYNLHGDRITHIIIEPTSFISGWEVHVDPEPHTANYNVSGVVEEVLENVALEPSEVVLEIPENPPAIRSEDAIVVFCSKEKAYKQIPALLMIKISRNFSFHLRSVKVEKALNPYPIRLHPAIAKHVPTENIYSPIIL